MTLRIGISARLLHRPPPGAGLPQKRLQYLESNLAQWIMSHGVVALMIPFIDKPMVSTRRRPLLDDLVEQLDGLVLQGGVDVCAETYGATPWMEHTDSDPIRDEYELDLLRGFIAARKPVLGVCRGCQLINVYFGGTLVQDIPTQWPEAISHQDLELYDGLTHEVRFAPGSRLARIYGQGPHRVNSIHHQCVNQPGKGIVIEARSPADGIPEAITHRDYPFIMGVQWHPEFHGPTEAHAAEPDTLDSTPLMLAFLEAARRRCSRVRRLTTGISRLRPRPADRRAQDRGTTRTGPQRG